MITAIFSQLVALIIKIISGSGYLGITLLMALESACIPIPSEVIMPFGLMSETCCISSIPGVNEKGRVALGIETPS